MPEGSHEIAGYTLSCWPDTRSLPLTVTSPGTYTLQGFDPATEYTCSIYAFTAYLHGLNTTVTVVTMDGSEAFVITKISEL